MVFTETPLLNEPGMAHVADPARIEVCPAKASAPRPCAAGALRMSRPCTQAYNEQIRYVCMRHAIHAHVAAIAAADQSQDGGDAGMCCCHCNGSAVHCMCAPGLIAERRPCLLFRRSVCKNKAADQGSAGPQRCGQRRGVPRCVAGLGSGLP
jgi:hypothetical protein